MKRNEINISYLKELFVKYYGESYHEIRVFTSPGRVNLIGEHIDYCGGSVFPAALTLSCAAAVRLNDSNVVNLRAEDLDGVYSFDLRNTLSGKSLKWGNYQAGVIHGLMEKGYYVRGMDLLFIGNIPFGSGLSSSAAIELTTAVAAATLSENFTEKGIDLVQMALIGQTAEHTFCNVHCGIMDQFASAMGKKDHAIFLDTSDLSYEYASVKLENAKIVITNSKVKHSLVDSAYNDRRNECETALKELQTVVDIKGLGDLSEEEFEKYKDAIKDPVRQKRAHHAVYENQRTIQAVAALNAGDVEKFGKLMNASHVSLRDDYEVSCEEIDVLVDLAWETEGVIGSRITGGGFGGCTVSIVKNDAVDHFIDKLGKAYKEKTGHEAEFYVVEIGDGAKEI